MLMSKQESESAMGSIFIGSKSSDGSLVKENSPGVKHFETQCHNPPHLGTVSLDATIT